jgi:hypothetical protein
MCLINPFHSPPSHFLKTMPFFKKLNPNFYTLNK